MVQHHGAIRSSGSLRGCRRRNKHPQSVFHLKRDARYQGLAGQTGGRRILLQTPSRALLLLLEISRYEERHSRASLPADLGELEPSWLVCAHRRVTRTQLEGYSMLGRGFPFPDTDTPVSIWVPSPWARATPTRAAESWRGCK